jgi:Pyruvate/2-oxoacid:ferredoxin oxidoreductase delta subunit
MERVDCHLCKKSEIDSLIHFKRNDEELNVSICNGCGLVLLSRILRNSRNYLRK